MTLREPVPTIIASPVAEEGRMTKGRLEAFSDGMNAILITIMVLELRVPHGTDLEALRTLLPVFFTYVLSFVFLGIYWNNHHHMLNAAGPIKWQDTLGKPAFVALVDLNP